jgi:hypothetical protein
MSEARMNSNGESAYLLDFEISPDEVESFFPLAESYMGKKANQIPVKERTLNKVRKGTASTKPKVKGLRKKVKNKKKMAKKSRRK